MRIRAHLEANRISVLMTAPSARYGERQWNLVARIFDAIFTCRLFIRFRRFGGRPADDSSRLPRTAAGRVNSLTSNGIELAKLRFAGKMDHCPRVAGLD